MTKGADGVFTAGPIWHNFMTRALQNKPVEVFTPPDSYPLDTNPILIGQGLGQVTLEINRLNNKLATSSTPPNLVEKRTYEQPHSILYYLNKDDLNAPPPLDPSQDPQFAGWEAAVMEWSQKQNIQTQNIPTEYDTTTSLDNIVLPKITILSPSANETISTRDININLQIENEQTIEKINYYLDDELLDFKTSTPFNYSTHLSEASRGFHNFKVRAYTASGVYSEASVDFNLTAPDDKPSVFWIFPTADTSLFSSQFPVSLKLRLSKIEKIKNFSISVISPDEQTKTLFTANNPTDKTILIPWNKTTLSGIYILKSQITTIDDETYESAGQRIEIK